MKQIIFYISVTMKYFITLFLLLAIFAPVWGDGTISTEQDYSYFATMPMSYSIFAPTNNVVFGGGEVDDPVMVITFDPPKIEVREGVEASDTAREVLRLMQEYLYDWCEQEQRMGGE